MSVLPFAPLLVLPGPYSWPGAIVVCDPPRLLVSLNTSLFSDFVFERLSFARLFLPTRLKENNRY